MAKYKKTMLLVIKDMMGEGASKTEVAAELGISRETLSQWQNENGEYYIKDFSDAIKRGVQLSGAWWEKKGRVNLDSRTFNPTLWYMNMRNRFGWADKIEQTDKTDYTELMRLASAKMD